MSNSLDQGAGRPLRLAILGAGAMAREHIKAFLDVPGISTEGIWNRTRNKAEMLAQQFGVPVVANNVGDLYARTRADLAIVAVYETPINPIMKQALSHPWAILMGKTLRLHLEEGEEIAAAAKMGHVSGGFYR